MPTNDTPSKRCSKCQRHLPREQFSRDRTCPDGLSHHCRECRSARMRAYYLNNRATFRQKGREYYQSHKEVTAERDRAYRAANRQAIAEKRAARVQAAPDKYKDIQRRADQKRAIDSPERLKARTMVGIAIRAGRLQRKPCEKCGNMRSEAHHHLGYTQEHWYDVQWLCHSCHTSVHYHLA